MVLDKGSIIEFDTPRNLLNNKDSYFYSIAISSGSIVEWILSKKIETLWNFKFFSQYNLNV